MRPSRCKLGERWVFIKPWKSCQGVFLTTSWWKELIWGPLEVICCPWYAGVAQESWPRKRGWNLLMQKVAALVAFCLLWTIHLEACVPWAKRQDGLFFFVFLVSLQAADVNQGWVAVPVCAVVDTQLCHLVWTECLEPQLYSGETPFLLRLFCK